MILARRRRENFEKTKVIKGIFLLKIAYFSPPQAEKNEKTKVIKGILLFKITYFSPPQAENFTISVCKNLRKIVKKRSTLFQNLRKIVKKSRTRERI